jgi:hypothetical protein
LITLYKASRFKSRSIIDVRGLRVRNLDVITGHLGVTNFSRALEDKIWTKTLKNKPRPLLFLFLNNYRA